MSFINVEEQALRDVNHFTSSGIFAPWPIRHLVILPASGTSRTFALFETLGSSKVARHIVNVIGKTFGAISFTTELVRHSHATGNTHQISAIDYSEMPIEKNVKC